MIICKLDPITERRIRDLAKALVPPTPGRTYGHTEMRLRLAVLHDAIAAAQSLDDLGAALNELVNSAAARLEQEHTSLKRLLQDNDDDKVQA